MCVCVSVGVRACLCVDMCMLMHTYALSLFLCRSLSLSLSPSLPLSLSLSVSLCVCLFLQAAGAATKPTDTGALAAPRGAMLPATPTSSRLHTIRANCGARCTPGTRAQTLFECKLRQCPRQCLLPSEDDWNFVRALRFNEQVGGTRPRYRGWNFPMPATTFMNTRNGYRHCLEVRCGWCRIQIDPHVAWRYLECHRTLGRWHCPFCGLSYDLHVLMHSDKNLVYIHRGQAYRIMQSLYQQCVPGTRPNDPSILTQLVHAWTAACANGKRVHAHLFLEALQEASGDADCFA